jgi:hypothetical protein
VEEPSLPPLASTNCPLVSIRHEDNSNGDDDVSIENENDSTRNEEVSKTNADICRNGT